MRPCPVAKLEHESLQIVILSHNLLYYTLSIFKQLTSFIYGSSLPQRTFRLAGVTATAHASNSSTRPCRPGLVQSTMFAVQHVITGKYRTLEPTARGFKRVWARTSR